MSSSSKTFFLHDSQATQQFGRVLGQVLPANSTILLEGDLGSGKTTLIQGVGQGLGISEPIISPTFTLINEYKEGRLPLYHLDLYRLQNKDVATIYPEIYWEGIEVEPGITAIEWSQKLDEKPSNYLKLQLDYSSEQGRQITWQVVGEIALVSNQGMPVSEDSVASWCATQWVGDLRGVAPLLPRSIAEFLEMLGKINQNLH